MLENIVENKPKLSGKSMTDLSSLDKMELVFELYKRNVSTDEIEGLYSTLDEWYDHNPKYILQSPDNALVEPQK